MAGAFIKSARWVNEIIARWELLEPGAPGARVIRSMDGSFDRSFN